MCCNECLQGLWAVHYKTVMWSLGSLDRPVFADELFPSLINRKDLSESHNLDNGTNHAQYTTGKYTALSDVLNHEVLIYTF